MMEWEIFELSEVCSRLKSGKNIKAANISDTGTIPVYGGNGVRGYTDNPNFEGECAIIGRQGAYCGNVRYFSGKAYMTEHAVVVCGNEKSNTRYLAYMLSTMSLGRLSGQSAQPGLSVKTLGIQKIQLPPKAIQEKCAHLLGLFDEKISKNEQINENLHEQRAGHRRNRKRLPGVCSRADGCDFGCIRRLPDSEEALLPSVALLAAA